MSNAQPRPGDYDSAAEYDAALADWNAMSDADRQAYDTAYDQAEQDLETGRRIRQPALGQMWTQHGLQNEPAAGRAKREAKEAENAERLRLAEIQALKVERAEVVAVRERTVQNADLSEQLIVVDAQGLPTGMTVKQVTTEERRAVHEAELARLDAKLEVIDQQLNLRNADADGASQ